MVDDDWFCDFFQQYELCGVQYVFVFVFGEYDVGFFLFCGCEYWVYYYVGVVDGCVELFVVCVYVLDWVCCDV